jgi:hypothetical protein
MVLWVEESGLFEDLRLVQVGGGRHVILRRGRSGWSGWSITAPEAASYVQTRFPEYISARPPDDCHLFSHNTRLLSSFMMNASLVWIGDLAKENSGEQRPHRQDRVSHLPGARRLC